MEPSIVLAILLIVVHSITRNRTLHLISLLGISTLISYWMTNDFAYGLLLGAVISAVIYMAQCSMPTLYEGLDNPKEEEDFEDIELDDDTPDAKDNEFMSAQKETFELINTVKQLKTTIEELGPLLKEGKNIMGLYKKLKI